MSQQGHGERILVVEDDTDSREALELLLSGEGYEVVGVGTAEDGLGALASTAFDVIVTDFNLPGHDGGWMLDEAAARGIVRDAPVIVVTAQPDLRRRGALTLVKPLDFDRVLLAVHDLLLMSSADRRPARAEQRASGGASDARGPELELVMYVSPGSIASGRALRNLERVLRRYRSDRISLSIVDVSTEPARAAEDRIDFTPVLRQVRPRPELRLLGDLRDPRVLETLLEAGGVEKK